MIRRPPRSTRTDTLFPYTTLFLSSNIPRNDNNEAAQIGIRGKFATGPITHEFNLGASHSRSEEHTSELQSLMRISYAVFCLKKKNQTLIRQILTPNHRQ